MLNPEVEKFPAPESHVQYACSSWHHQRHHHQQLITHHPFNTQVSLLLPGCARVPPEFSNVLTHDTQFYHITALPLHHLCTPAFIQAFIDTGKVYALSCDTRLDVDSAAAISPDGRLHLILGKLMYQELPLSGHLSQHILRTPKDKYVVEANLKDCGCDERVSCALKQVDLVFNWWLAWVPDDPEVCPSSIAKYFHDFGFEVIEQQTKLRWNVVSQALMPTLAKLQEEEDESMQIDLEGQETKQKLREGWDEMDIKLEGQEMKQKQRDEEQMYIELERQEAKQEKSRGELNKMYSKVKGHETKQEKSREEDDEMDPEEVLEWIGCQALGINLLGEGSTVCDIDAPRPCVRVTNLCSAHFSGLFPPAVITKLVQWLREWLDVQSSELVPWASVTVYGHPDSPVAWAGREHRYSANGDNFYTLIITRQEVRSFKVSGPRRPSRLYVKANKNK